MSWKGSPCLRLECPNFAPQFSTDNDWKFFWWNALSIQLLHLSPNPLTLKISSRNPDLPYWWPFQPLLYHSSMSSFAVREASRIWHPATKANWFSMIVLGITHFSLSNRILAMILYKQVIQTHQWHWKWRKIGLSMLLLLVSWRMIKKDCIW